MGQWRHAKEVSIWFLVVVDTTKVEGKVIKGILSYMIQ